LIGGRAAQAQTPAASGAASLARVDGTDAVSGIHYVRLTIALPAAADRTAPPHLTMECTEVEGKRDLSWFVAFGRVESAGFVAPFHATPERPHAPKNPSEKLTMDFEGYTKWKPVTRVWEALPSGELRYRNPGMHSPNLENPRAFLVYLSSLPALRIGYASPRTGGPAEVVFQTRPLLDELAKTPICQP
jgi:hypothetical protein